MKVIKLKMFFILKNSFMFTLKGFPGLLKKSWALVGLILVTEGYLAYSNLQMFSVGQLPGSQGLNLQSILSLMVLILLLPLKTNIMADVFKKDSPALGFFGLTFGKVEFRYLGNFILVNLLLFLRMLPPTILFGLSSVFLSGFLFEVIGGILFALVAVCICIYTFTRYSMFYIFVYGQQKKFLSHLLTRGFKGSIFGLDFQNLRLDHVKSFLRFGSSF